MKTLLLVTSLIFGTLFVPAVSYAAIDVQFESTPLFGISNFLPGDTITKTVTVTNTGEATEDVYTELLNVVDGGLAPMLDVEITSGGTLFSGSFNAFDSANEQFLSTLAPSASVVYTYKMTFKPQAGNEYQLKSLGFDICVGFSGGQFECDATDDPNYAQSSYGNNYSQGSYGGGGGNNTPNGEVEGSSSSRKPAPQVLGDQVSIIPNGAPNTGLGGGTTLNLLVAVLLFGFVVVFFFKQKKHVR